MRRAQNARLRETLDVLADPKLMATICRGRAYFRRGGKGIPLERVFPESDVEVVPRKR
jgi:hypothetical protein